MAPTPRSAPRPQMGWHRRSRLGFDDARCELHLVVVLIAGHEFLDWVVVRLMLELMLVPVVAQLWMLAVVERRDGDVPLDLLVWEVLTAVLGVVPWPGRLEGLEHFSRGGAGMDELPFVGGAGRVAVFDEVEAFAAGAVGVFAHAFFDFDAAF